MWVLGGGECPVILLSRNLKLLRHGKPLSIGYIKYLKLRFGV